MIVHLFPKSQFTEEFVDFINSHFDRDEHCFVLYTNRHFDVASRIYEMQNVFDYDRHNIGWLYGILSEANKVILYNFGLCVKELILYFLSSRLCKKLSGLYGESDLYCHRDLRVRMTDKIIEYMRTKVIRRFPIIATLTDEDYTLVQEWYYAKAPNVRLDYCEEHTIRLMKQYAVNPVKRDAFVVNILLGNSATQTNQHIEIIRVLERFKEEDIRIYVPLS